MYIQKHHDGICNFNVDATEEYDTNVVINYERK